ncbi:hypothetical protein B0I33_103449 [Prauserella shujinwangii]|uniref:BFN domain-containing protein n=1 Tax=Prauserella shujinwangii TaxID=1453103 RepID=A0A2T0LZ72_9PSEU|nr:hypothetical protein B0I33_103449 [Prauserella shujinwangii]
MSAVIPVRVHGVALLPPDETPVMLLQETVGEQRWLPISIGAPEAGALIAAYQEVEHVRPDTIELIGHVVEALGRRVERVEVTALEEGIFLADLVFDDDTRVSARPSDAVAIAVRAGATLEVDEDVLDAAAAEIQFAGEPDPADAEQQIADFRAALDDVKPEDFGDRPD